MKLQGVSREQFHFQAIGNWISALSAAQRLHCLMVKDRERTTSIHEEEHVDKRQRVLRTGWTITVTLTSARQVNQKTFVVANNASIHCRFFVALVLLFLLQVRKMGRSLVRYEAVMVSNENVELWGAR